MLGNLDLYLYWLQDSKHFLPLPRWYAYHKISPFGYTKDDHVKPQWWQDIKWDLAKVFLVEMRKETCVTAWTLLDFRTILMVNS